VAWSNAATRCGVARAAPLRPRAPRTVLSSTAMTRRPSITLVRVHRKDPTSRSRTSASRRANSFQRRLLRCRLDPKPGQLRSRQIASPTADRRERAGTREHRAHRDREDPCQRVPHPARITRIRHLGEQLHQLSPTLPWGRNSTDRGRWHRRVCPRCDGESQHFHQATQDTLVSHATPVTRPQTGRSQPRKPTFPVPWFTPPLAFNVRVSATRSPRPRTLRQSQGRNWAGTNPAQDTRFGSSQVEVLHSFRTVGPSRMG